MDSVGTSLTTRVGQINLERQKLKTETELHSIKVFFFSFINVLGEIKCTRSTSTSYFNGICSPDFKTPSYCGFPFKVLNGSGSKLYAEIPPFKHYILYEYMGAKSEHTDLIFQLLLFS